MVGGIDLRARCWPGDGPSVGEFADMAKENPEGGCGRERRGGRNTNRGCGGIFAGISGSGGGSSDVVLDASGGGALVCRVRVSGREAAACALLSFAEPVHEARFRGDGRGDVTGVGTSNENCCWCSC